MHYRAALLVMWSVPSRRRTWRLGVRQRLGLPPRNRPFSRHAVKALLVAAYCVASVAQAQPRAISDVPNRATCADCSIVVSPLLSLGSDDGPGALAGHVYDGIKDSKGNYYLLAGARAVPIGFDSRGRFLRQLGRLGPGPGEFATAVNVELLAGDSIVVFERRRAHVFDPRGTVVRTVTVPAAAIARAVRDGGGAIVAGAVQTRSAIGLPFHFLTPRFDSVTMSFGAETGTDPAGVPQGASVLLAGSRDRAFWSVRANDYLLVRWDSLGTARQLLRRRPEWWQGKGDPVGGDIATVAPPSGVRALQETTDGLLLIVSTVPGPRWREGYGPRRPDGVYEVGKMRIDLLYDTMLEVVDPRSLQLLASSRTPGAAVAFVAPGELLFIAEEESGVPKGVVKKVEFRRASRP